jgi:CheY-like chemotaxis protein
MRNVLRSVPLAQTPAAAAAGRPTFTDILLERGLVSRNDLNIAEQHAAREKLELAEALILLALVPENHCYAALARAAGLSLIDLAGTEASELAVRLVPEKLARRHVVVPLAVDNRTLTYATFRPFDPEAERDLAFASGRRTQAVLASRNGVLDTLERCYPKLRDETDKGRLADSIEEVNRVLSAELTQVRTGPKTEARVLITDDDPITRMLVKILLERENYEVIDATNGREAVEIATRERPDLLLIDLNMPEVDGYEAIARLRKDFSMTTLPIVVLTAEDSPGIEQRVLQLGADDFILKPFEAPALLSRVHAVFHRLKVGAAA